MNALLNYASGTGSSSRVPFSSFFKNRHREFLIHQYEVAYLVMRPRKRKGRYIVVAAIFEYRPMSEIKKRLSERILGNTTLNIVFPSIIQDNIPVVSSR